MGLAKHDHTAQIARLPASWGSLKRATAVK
jgi:hypothetical protein